MKALEAKLTPIVVINKIDRPDARIPEVLDEIYDLFIDLDAHEDQLDFPVLYTNAKAGTATVKLDEPSENLQPLFEAIVKNIPPPAGDPEAVLQMLVANLDYSDYLAAGIGRVFSGTLHFGDDVAITKLDGSMHKTRITKLYSFEGLKRVDETIGCPGDILAIAGVEGITIGETITSIESPKPLPHIQIDEPTIAMTFTINTSPFAGKEGSLVTSRNLRDRLDKELLTNVSIKSGAGRRSRYLQSDGTRRAATGDPYRNDAQGESRADGREARDPDPHHQRQAARAVGAPGDRLSRGLPGRGDRETRRAQRQDEQDGEPRLGRVRLEFLVPSRGLIGLRSEILTDTRGTAIMNSCSTATSNGRAIFIRGPPARWSPTVPASVLGTRSGPCRSAAKSWSLREPRSTRE